MGQDLCMNIFIMLKCYIYFILLAQFCIIFEDVQ